MNYLYLAAEPFSFYEVKTRRRLFRLPEANIAVVDGERQGLLHQHVGGELLLEGLVDLHVLLVPVLQGNPFKLQISQVANAMLRHAQHKYLHKILCSKLKSEMCTVGYSDYNIFKENSRVSHPILILTSKKINKRILGSLSRYCIHICKYFWDLVEFKFTRNGLTFLTTIVKNTIWHIFVGESHQVVKITVT
jgi:hypothetical protein